MDEIQVCMEIQNGEEVFEVFNLVKYEEEVYIDDGMIIILMGKDEVIKLPYHGAMPVKGLEDDDGGWTLEWNVNENVKVWMMAG